MSRGLGCLARRISAPQALLPKRGGGGGPLATHIPPTAPLREEDELIWDDGTANPEFVLDREPLYTQWQGLAFVASGLGFFGLVGLAAQINNKPSKIPYAPKQYPNDLMEDTGGYSGFVR